MTKTHDSVRSTADAVTGEVVRLFDGNALSLSHASSERLGLSN